MNLPGLWVDRVHKGRSLKQIILDMDSSVSQTHGHQEDSAYNGYFEYTCYHPLFCFNQYGDIERVLLRKGNVHSADDWQSVLEPVIAIVFSNHVIAVNLALKLPINVKM